MMNRTVASLLVSAALAISYFDATAQTTSAKGKSSPHRFS